MLFSRVDGEIEGSRNGRRVSQRGRVYVGESKDINKYQNAGYACPVSWTDFNSKNAAFCVVGSMGSCFLVGARVEFNG